MKRAIPELTLVHATVIAIISGGDVPGKLIREELIQRGWSEIKPAFYNLMKRMEQKKLVIGEYAVIEHSTYAVRERRYRVAPKGALAYEEFLAFVKDISSKRLT